MLSDLVGAQLQETTDWQRILDLLSGGGHSVIIEFQRPGGADGDTVLWTLRDRVNDKIRLHDPAYEPGIHRAGYVVEEAGLPSRECTGDGHQLVDAVALGNVFRNGRGRALLPV